MMEPDRSCANKSGQIHLLTTNQGTLDRNRTVLADHVPKLLRRIAAQWEEIVAPAQGGADVRTSELIRA